MARRTWGTCAVIALLLVSPRLLAQDDDLEEELFFEPAETVTSAARHAQPLELSPSAVTVITREDIEASGARTLPEVLRLVPGMDVYFVKPFWYAVGMRGITSITSDTVLLLVDGRDATLEFFGFPLWTLLHFSMDDIERIEVIRGPGSALYGANAYTGVVHVITRRPPDHLSAEASLRGGEHGYAEFSARAGHAFGPVAVAAEAGVVREDLFSGRDLKSREVIRGRLTADLELGQESALQIEAGALSPNGRFYTNIGETVLDEGLLAYGMLRYNLGDLVARAVFEHTDFEGEFGMLLEYAGLTIAEVPRVTARNDKVVTSLEHVAELFHNRLTYGAEYVLNLYHSELMVDPDHVEHRFGVYLQDEVDLEALLEAWLERDMPPLVLTAGLRFDENSVTQWELSPRASLVYAPGTGQSIRLGYAHAFRKPTFFESSLDIRLESDFGFKHLDSIYPGLDNESIDSLELGYRGTFLQGKLRIHFDLAFNWYHDTILYNYNLADLGFIQVGAFRIPNLNGPGLDFRNHPHGRRGHNVELEVVTRPADWLRLFFTTSYRQVFDDGTGAFEHDEPVWRLAAGVDTRTASGIQASLRAFYVAARHSEFRGPGGALEPNLVVELPAIWFLNLRVAVPLDMDPYQVQAGLEAFNLLDNRFREFGGMPRHVGPDFAAEQLGRRLILFLRGSL